MDSGEFDKDQTKSFTALTPGAKVSHYIIKGKIGAGGMGEVYLARDESLEREVALKFLPLDQTHDPDRRERFKREALAVAKLSHPNIVHVFRDGVYRRTIPAGDYDQNGNWHRPGNQYCAAGY
jgi:serine/threonine protein kinase